MAFIKREYKMNSKYPAHLAYSVLKCPLETHRNILESIEIGMYKLYFQTQIIYNCKKNF